MAVCPFAERRLIPPGANDPRINATQVILHVAVSEGASLYDYFRSRSGGVESHFYIRRDGTIEQYRDTAFEADANHTANSRAISVETQGMAAGEWTPEQVASIKRLLLWARDTHGIPLRRCPRHDAPGVGYHVMFGAPGPWTPVAKSCPGPERVRQFDRVLVPWMSGEPTKAQSKPTPATEGDDDMWLDDAINVHDPAGRAETQQVTGRELLTALAIFLNSQPGPHQAYLEAARKSKVE